MNNHIHPFYKKPGKAVSCPKFIHNYLIFHGFIMTESWTVLRLLVLIQISECNWNSASKLNLNLVDPVVKDTVLVPALGYVVIRFRTDNPGLWLMHCHQEMHAIEGMTIAWNEAPERQRTPPEDFPTCGDAYREMSPNQAAVVELHHMCCVAVSLLIMTATKI